MAFSDLTSTDAQITGIFSCLIVIIGLILFCQLLYRYLKKKQYDILLTAFGLLSVACNWLAPAVNFILIVNNSKPLVPKAHLAIFAWALPCTAVLWLFLGFRIAFPKYKFHALLISSLIGIIHLFLAYIMVQLSEPKITSEGTNFGNLMLYKYTEGKLPNSTSIGFLLLSTLILIIITTLLVSSLFIWASYSTKRGDLRIRGALIGIGALIIGLSGIIDEVFNEGAWLIMAKSGVVIGLILIYFGYLLPQWLKTFLRVGN